jgi:methylmalonyl-CoA epimerase
MDVRHRTEVSFIFKPSKLFIEKSLRIKEEKMQVKKLDHIAIVVKDITEALMLYEKALGLQPTSIEVVESYQVKVAFLPIGDTRIEFIQPLDDDSKLAAFLRKTGGGLHHLAVEVDDVVMAIDEMEQQGLTMKDKAPQVGAHQTKVAFAARQSFAGAVIEFVSK